MNAFYILGTLSFAIYITKSVLMAYELHRLRQHDKECEDCADRLMAETFKNIRERDDR